MISTFLAEPETQTSIKTVTFNFIFQNAKKNMYKSCYRGGKKLKIACRSPDSRARGRKELNLKAGNMAHEHFFTKIMV